jgi:hypothetical protein
MVEEANYIVYFSEGYYAAIDGRTEEIAYGGPDDAGGIDGTDFSDVVNACVQELKDNGIGGVIFIKAGVYYANSTIVVNGDGIKIRGAGAYGDVHLTADQNYLGITPRNSTVIVDNSTAGIDVIAIGDDNTVIKGVQLREFAITGKLPPWSGNTDWKDYSGIRTYSARAGTIIERISVYRKKYGILLGTRTGNYNHTKNNEAMIIRDIQFAYCDFGLARASDDFLFVDSVVEDIMGYYCYEGLITSNRNTLNVVFDKIHGQMVGYKSDAQAVNVWVYGDVALNDVQIDNNNGNDYSGSVGIYLNPTNDTAAFTVVDIKNPVITGVDYGIYIPYTDPAAHMTVNIRNPYLGIYGNGPQIHAPLGGCWGIVQGAVLNQNDPSTVKVYIEKGMCRVSTAQFSGGQYTGQSDVANKYALGWFKGTTKIEDVYGFNPMGVNSTCWDNDNLLVGIECAAFAQPTHANSKYVVNGLNLIIKITGCNGTATLYDASNNAIGTYAYTTLGSTVIYLPLGVKIAFSNVTRISTVVYGD